MNRVAYIESRELPALSGLHCVSRQAYVLLCVAVLTMSQVR
jgi:hypothetical protein